MHPPLHELLDQLFLILINGGIVLGIFVILLINNKGARKSRANVFLSVLLASLTFSVFHLRYAGDVISHFAVEAYNIGDPTFLLIAPLLWFYIIELTGGRVTFNVTACLHFLPFLAIVFCSISFKSILSHNPFILFLDSHPRLPFTIFWIIIVVQFSGYQYRIHRKWMEYQQIIRQEVSNTEDVNISWVKFFMGVFLLVNIFFLFSLFAVIHLDYVNWMWKSVGVILSLSIFALGFKGIQQKEIIFSTAAHEPAVQLETTVFKPDRSDQKLITRLLEHMEKQRPYLDPELSLSTLAKELGINRNQLSQSINDGLGENFYDFVNKYRVEEVKRLMADPDKQNYNLLGIAVEAGFKSKSTFNLIFKRFTGLTPTEYKKNIT